MEENKPQVSEDIAHEEELLGVSNGTEYFIGNSKYYRVSYSPIVDEVDGLYTILFNKPLPELDTAMAKAYAVTDKRTKNAQNLYAVIPDKKFPVRLAEINKLIGRRQEGFVNVISAQVVKRSGGGGSVYAIILEKPEGTTLGEYIKKNGSISEDAISSKIISKIGAVIRFLSAMNIVHGRINPENIYVQSNGDVLLGECVSEICGYSQPMMYESINRALCMPIAKGNGVVGSTDYYALGIIVTIMLRGKNPVENYSEAEVLQKRLAENTYRVFSDRMEFSVRMKDFLIGVINDNNKELWDVTAVDGWIKGRGFNLLAPGEHRDAGRPVVFNGKKYFNKKYLAHDLYLNWEESKKFIREDTLVRWVERSVQDKDLAERMEMLSNRIGVDIGGHFDKNDELLAQYILLLDPSGIIRIKGYSAFVDGISTALSLGYAGNRKSYIDAFEIIIMYGLLSYINFDKIAKDGKNNIKESIFILNRSSEWLRKKDFGFGTERCLYETNPTLQCQSPLVQDDCVFGIADMMKSLDAGKQAGGSIIDRHIGAFLSARLELPSKIRINSLMKFPDFLANTHIQMLALLSLSQQESRVGDLPGLALRVNEVLKRVVDEFHSKYVRKELEDRLDKVVRKGNLQLILKIITDSQYLVRDRLGFRRAVNKYRTNSALIIKLANKKAIFNMGYRYGLHLSVLISFFVATIVTMILVVKLF